MSTAVEHVDEGECCPPRCGVEGDGQVSFASACVEEAETVAAGVVLVVVDFVLPARQHAGLLGRR